MLFTFLLIVQAIIGATLVTVILMQRSEGGGLGMGGSPAGLMSARGAADFLTRSTSILATVFVALSILLAVLAATRQKVTIDPTLARTPPASTAPAQPPAPAAQDDAALSEAARAAIGNAPAPAPGTTANSVVPFEQ